MTGELTGGRADAARPDRRDRAEMPATRINTRRRRISPARPDQRRARRRFLVGAMGLTVTAITMSLALGGSGDSSASVRTALARYLAAWERGDWGAMRSQVLDPPADFANINAQAFRALGVTRASFVPMRVIMGRSGTAARAHVREHFDLPHVGSWTPGTTVRLIKRDGAWHVNWSPATINPSLRAGDKLVVRKVWPSRGPVLGAGGARLTSSVRRVVVGVLGIRIQSASDLRTDLLAAGATPAQVRLALAQAVAHPTEFEPVFTVSQARFEQLKSQRGSRNVYSVPGTAFKSTSAPAAITAQLAAHVVGSLGPITAEELRTLGDPYDSSSVVGQSGLEASQERTLAGAPSTHVDVEDARGKPIKLLASFGGRPGAAVRTSIDPQVQRAAEGALARSTRPNVSMVAMRASTGQVLAVVADPLSTYDTALQGAYPPGSTFKVLTFTALHRHGLAPASPTSCRRP